VGIGDVSELIGRSPDTLRRWEKDGLLKPSRDRIGRRVYSEEDVERCRVLARLSLHAQNHSKKLALLFAEATVQLSLFEPEQ
jgi:DNA-binding transcriptional MerR regulator